VSIERVPEFQNDCSTAPMTASPPGLPLCVDLDGTLTYADISMESLLCALKRAPWLLPAMLAWRLSGKHALKFELSKRADIDATVLPYNDEVLALVRTARSEGRKTVLVTGSNRKFAQQVQDHLGLFDEVFASDEDCNLTGTRKAAKLNAEFGEGLYEYVSNGTVDLPIWRGAAAVTTVNAPRAVVRQCAAMGKPHRDFPVARRPLRSWSKAMRLHQWAKNALLFVPLITSHAVLQWSAVISVAVAFFAFGLCASATYIINDVLDLDSDRHHRRKKLRPFASGALSLKQAAVGCAAMLAGGLWLAAMLPARFQLALGGYIVFTLLYSLRLKKVASIDVLTLAGLYTLRVVAGAFAASIELSFWLLAFSMFVFLCLALVKRVAELVELRAKQLLGSAQHGFARGREYTVEDIGILQNLGATSGYLAVLVLALYINSPEVSQLYATPEALWLIAPLMLLWVTRLWVVTTRGYMDEDPILFAIKDPETWITAGVTAAIMFVATTFHL
jgi:4-hydroxybenzoate polyprenyltransferase/phosphoserine phosphatase